MEEDKIAHMAAQIRKAHHFNSLTHQILRILKSHRVVKPSVKVKPHLVSEDTDECSFILKLDADQTLKGEELEIMIKPDHGGHKELRLVVEQGGKLVINKKIDRDKPGRSDKKVFEKEVHAAERLLQKVR